MIAAILMLVLACLLLWAGWRTLGTSGDDQEEIATGIMIMLIGVVLAIAGLKTLFAPGVLPW